jgi:WD40 repeat protein
LEERLVRLTPGTSAADDQVEVAHEALVRNWPRLVEWLEDEKAAIAVRRRLESRAAEWVRLGRGDGGLFDEVELREAERWLRGSEATYLGYDPALDALVAASEEALGRAEREREAIHARELAQARALAEANQRRIEEQEQTAQRLRRAVVIGRVASVVALIAAIAAVIFGAQVAEQADEVIRSGNALRAQAATAEAARAEAQTQQQTAVAAQAAADQQRATAEAARSAAEAARATAVVEQQNALEQGLLARSGQLAAQAQSALREEPQRSLLLAVEAVRIAASGAAEDTLTTTLNATNGIGLSSHSAEVLATVLSSDGRWLASGSADQTVRVWTTSEGRPTASVVLPGHNGPVILLEASADNRWLVSASTDTTARIWDMASTDPAAGVRVLTGHNGPITALAISPNSRWLVTTSEDQTARLWDLNAADPATSGFVLRGHTGTVTSVAISANNRWIITGSLDSTARIWALEGGTVGKFTSLVRQRGDIRAVAISPDSRFFVTGGSDGSNNRRGRIELRTLTTSGSGESPSVLSADQGLVTQLVYSPNGRWLASVGTDRTVRMWNALSMTSATPESTVLSGHEQPISALVFSPDSRWLATASADQSAILWDVAAADPAASSYVLRGHDGPLTSTAMSATGALITGSADTSIRLWQIPPSERTAIIGGASIDQRINLACQTAGRNLTTEEWEQAFPGQPFRKTCPEF